MFFYNRDGELIKEIISISFQAKIFSADLISIGTFCSQK